MSDEQKLVGRNFARRERRMNVGTMVVTLCALASALTWLTPSDVLSSSPALASFVSSMERLFPAIRAYSNLSPHNEVVALVLAMMWALLPALLWINATKVHVFERWQPRHVKGVKGFLSLLALFALTALCAWLVGFSEPDSIQRPLGRANAFVYGLTQSRTALAILSSLTFLAITWFSLAFVRTFQVMRSSSR